MSSLFAGWSQKKFSEAIFKKPKKIELLFLVHMSQLSLSEELHLIFFAFWRVSSSLRPRHCSIDKMVIYRGSVCPLHQIVSFLTLLCYKFFS